MENNNVNDSYHTSLMNELIEGRDLTMKLQQFIFGNEPYYSSSNEEIGIVAHTILAKFERSLQILQYGSIINQSSSQVHKDTTGKVDSPNSSNKSPKSQDSDDDFKGLPEHKDSSRKRRNALRVTHKVQGSTSSGLEGPIEDGYNWRKYGQKDIFGANYPRAYYRCTYKAIHGCQATKQVQRCDEDPSFFEVTYRGKHNCSQASSSSSSFPSNPTPQIEPKLETLAYHPQNIIWDFQHDRNLNDLKPIINNICESLPQSTSFTFASKSNSLVDHQQTPNTMLRCKEKVEDDANFLNNTHQSPPNFNVNNQDFAIDHYSQGVQDIIHPSSTTRDTNSAIGSQLSFDHPGEYDNEFIFEGPHLFQ